MKKRNVLTLLCFSSLLAGCTFDFRFTMSSTDQPSASSAVTEETSSFNNALISKQEVSSSNTASSDRISSSSPARSVSSSGYVPAGYSLKWSDEFDGTSLDARCWTPQLGNGNDYGIWGWGNNEQEFYKAENATVSDGLLHIAAKKEDTVFGTTTYHYTSARLRTMGKVFTTYGYIEARIKLPPIVGMWPAFWMLPEANYQNKGWPTSGELDIMENRGRETTIVGGTTHSANDSYADVYHTQAITMASSIENWHIYAMEWTSEAVKFFADGILYNTVNRDVWVNGCSLYQGGPAPFNQPFHVILNLAVGGNYDGGRLPPSEFLSAEMSVDYVRIFQK